MRKQTYIQELLEERAYHIEESKRELRRLDCASPDTKSFWAAYHRRKAHQIGQIIKRALSG